MQISSVHFLFTVFVIMLCLVIALVIVVLIYNFIEYNRSSKEAIWSVIINRKISEVIVYAEEELPEDPQFEAHIVKPKFRNLFLMKLVDSEKKFSGAAKFKINDLFKEYNLKKEALAKLDQKKTYLIARGIRELTVMDVDVAEPKIASFLQHSSPQVYQEAQYAMVRFKGFEGLMFLDNLESKISEWQQLRMLLSIFSIPSDSESDIKNRLLSSNETVVVFTLKIIKKFQLLSLYPQVKELLKNPSVEIRIRAVQTLTSLDNPETIPFLVNIYETQPDEVKLEIISAMKISKDQCCIDLLKLELSEKHPSDIRVNAAQALFLLGHSAYLSELKQQQSSSQELVQIVKYALQEKVC